MKYNFPTAIELYIGEVMQLSNNIAFSDSDKEQALLTETIQRLMFINPRDQQKKEEPPHGPRPDPDRHPSEDATPTDATDTSAESATITSDNSNYLTHHRAHVWYHHV